MVTSLELHLEERDDGVTSVESLRDVGCGIYPCYYARRGEELLAATSVVDLVAELGSLELNEAFEVPEYIEQLSERGDQKERTGIERALLELPVSFEEYVPARLEQLLRATPLLADTSANLWYAGWDTIDERISRLRPFETVTPGRTRREFDPTYALDDPGLLIERTVDHLTRFVHRMEREFPDHQHVVLTGGKDSQLILLVPKLTDNWHAFSAEPNYPLVEEFVRENGLTVTRLFRHDNSNEESLEDLQRKLLCSDLLSDPRHIRWVVTLEEIANEFDGDCIFWSGMEADTIYSYFPEFHESYYYFEGHLERAASWQANIIQTTRNFTGAPHVSPYHSARIWEAVYRHYDPSMMEPGQDLRPEIGRRLHGAPVEWPAENPGPDPYEYDLDVDPLELYLEGIGERLEHPVPTPQPGVGARNS